MSVNVFGSINLDLFFDTDHFVRPGETLKAKRQSCAAGGKGLNQAIACAKAGASVWMGGRIGPDGQFLRDLLQESGVCAEGIGTVHDRLTGKAVIQRCQGENSILLDPGANGGLNQSAYECLFSSMPKAQFLLIQNEIPDPSFILTQAGKYSLPVIFNPAPISDEIRACPMDTVKYLIVNETECQDLFPQAEEIPAAMEHWIRTHPDSSIIVTLGKKGALYQDREQRLFMPSYPAKTADSTGAGDTFTGYFAAALDGGLPAAQALQLACAAASLSVEKEGASSSIPSRCEAEERIRQNPSIHPVRF